MRSLSFTERTALETGTLDLRARVSILTAEGWMDLSNVYGQDFLLAVSWAGDVDDYSARGSVTIAKSVHHLSSSPLNTESRLWKQAGGGGQFLSEGGRILVEVAIGPAGGNRPAKVVVTS